MSISGWHVHCYINKERNLDMGLEVGSLEKPLNVNSPIGTRVSVDQICRDCDLEISEILLIVDVRVMDMLEFEIILGMDWLTAH